MKKKFKSIQKLLLGRIRLALCCLSFVLFCMILSSASVLTQNTLSITMQQLAINSADNLNAQLSIFRVAMDDLPNYPAFANPQENREAIVEILNSKSEQYWCLSSFADLSGEDYVTGTNVSNEVFFQKGLQGESFVSMPNSVMSPGAIVYVISNPVYVGEELVGVSYMTPDYEYLYGLLTEHAVGETGHVYVINSNDQVIFDLELATAMKTGSAGHMDKTATHLDFEVQAKSITAAEGVGFGNFFEGDTVRVGGYAPVPNSDGWILLTTAESFEFLEQLPIVLFGSLCISLIVTFFFTVVLSKSITDVIRPINQCIERILALSAGDLKSPVPDIKRSDEVGQLADSTRSIVNSLSHLIADEQYVLGEMAKGNFSVSSREEEVYIGDFAPLLDALTRILDSMNATMSQISQASDQVTQGAAHMASSSTSLAEGASTQASSTKELSEVLDHISDQVATSSQRATDARSLSERTGEEVRSGNEYMSQLLGAMDDISVSSQKIEQIIKSIEDIAFQTNILALNAAVEAARAGSAGSGFAVVADEVRNLANRSADNAKETALLINTTMDAVRNGTNIANQTAGSLNNVVKGVEEAILAIHDIAQAMEEQSHEIDKITENMESITGVIQDTSATSIESASTSQELSAQAASLRELLEHFKLRGGKFGF